MVATMGGYRGCKLGFFALLLIAATVVGADASAREKGAGKDAHAAKGTRVGMASFYGSGLHGKKTASGKKFDKTAMVAAHPTLPLGTRVRVTNLGNGRSEELRIIDRGPTRKSQRRGVIIDVSEHAANKLGFRKKGKARVKVEVLEWDKKGK
jgi:rare lipoprotein A